MKKNIFNSLMIVASAIVIVGCGKFFQQNPLSNVIGPVQQSKPVAEKPANPDPVDSDAVKILAPDSITFKELQEDHFTFSTKVLIADYEAVVSVDNIDAFPGATFDSSTGELKWTPPKGYVVDNISQETELILVAVAESKKQNEAPLIRKKSVKVFVTRAYSAPTIKSISKGDYSMREGEYKYIDVVIKDMDGGATESQFPRLQILPAKQGLNLAPLVVIYNVSVNFQNREWTYRLRLDAREVELTSDLTIGYFRVQATNRYGMSTSVGEVEMKVFTKLSDLENSWDKNTEVTPGEKINIPFVVYDPKGEGKLSINAGKTILPAGSKLDCKLTKKAVLSCRFMWDVPYNDRIQYLQIQMEIESRNSDPSDREYIRNQFVLPLKVLYGPKPVPTPTPNPGPSPVPTPEPTPEPTPIQIPGPHFYSLNFVTRGEVC